MKKKIEFVKNRLGEDDGAYRITYSLWGITLYTIIKTQVEKL